MDKTITFIITLKAMDNLLFGIKDNCFKSTRVNANLKQLSINIDMIVYVCII